MEQQQPSFADQTSPEVFMKSDLTAAIRNRMRLPYVLRRVPENSFSSLLPLSGHPSPGDVALAQLEKIGRNANLDLPNERRARFHEAEAVLLFFRHPNE